MKQFVSYTAVLLIENETVADWLNHRRTCWTGYPSLGSDTPGHYLYMHPLDGQLSKAEVQCEHVPMVQPAGQIQVKTPGP